MVEREAKTPSGQANGGGEGPGGAREPGQAAAGATAGYHLTPAAGTTAAQRVSPARPGSRWTGWYRSLGRRGRIGLGAGAVAVAVAVALSVIGSGKPAPALPQAKNFTVGVLGHPGQHLSLSQYAGKPVILNFFASWCAPCQKETPLIAKFYRDSHGKVTIIGIDVNDGTSPALKFVHASGVTYPVGTDPAPMPTAALYGITGLPQTFFLNSQHKIVKRIPGAVTLHELQAGVTLMDQSS